MRFCAPTICLRSPSFLNVTTTNLRVIRDYRKTLSNAKLYYVSRAGVSIDFEHPQLPMRVMLAFLLEPAQSLPLRTVRTHETIHPQPTGRTDVFAAGAISPGSRSTAPGARLARLPFF